MPIDTTHGEYDAMLPLWERMRDTSAGQDAIRAQTTKYVPCPSGLDRRGAYPAYLLRGLFYNAVRRTLAALCGLIFQKAPVVVVAESVRPFLLDVSLADQSLDLLALDVVREVLKVGRYAVLVDWSASAARPYMAGYRAEDLMHWRVERRGGDSVLVRAILAETVETADPTDESTVTRAAQYRELVLTVDGIYQQRVWTRSSAVGSTKETFTAGSWVRPTRRGQSLPFIPFVIFGASALGPHVEQPPLLDLADVNLSHFRSSCDREHALFYVASPTPWVTGAKGTGPLKIGSSTAWNLDLHGTAGMLEISGVGIGSITIAMEEKMKMCASLGARLLEDQPRAAETATAVSMRHSGEHAVLRTLAQVVEQGLTLALQWFTWWLSTEAMPAATGASIELNKDFFAMKLSATELQALVQGWQADCLSYESLFYNLSRGGIMRPGVSVDDERAAIARQAEPRPPTGHHD
jgi:hypothetical protein